MGYIRINLLLLLLIIITRMFLGLTIRRLVRVGVVKDQFPHYGTKTKEMFNLAAVTKKGLILVVEESVNSGEHPREAT